MTTLALRERQALCDLALELGEDAPTLCEGWDARDLVAHLLVRERRPIASSGNMIGALSGLTERAMARERRKPYAALVDRLRSPAPVLRVVPGLDSAMNSFEMLVHHEDLRRGQAGWEPRELAPADLDALWSQLARGGAFLGRKLPVPTQLRRTDTGAVATARKGADPAVVAGPVVELALFLFGRDATRGITVEGTDEQVAAIRSAELGV
ncbi:TIGR03085 family metal-binding protein [Nocardioides mangrovi]|uniref:TIGR03085 family protein n=1 Tax=Nocardioides mangrovi TaxID=2874580 RepID=A0ABS7U7I8_9ACTN|nr:TIGR03085 family metal-binding protein [Nocardioides mangrovi]MBZ5736844.1 TIGR03085 family protein [Nocardioides mangrovi]